MNLLLVGKRIQESRIRKHLSQAELAELIDLSTYHVGSIETGKRGLSLDALVKIAEALDVTTDSLLLGFKRSSPSKYVDDIAALFAECSTFEQSVLMKLLYTTRSALQESMHLLDNNQSDLW